MNARCNLLRALFFVELFRQPETYHVATATLVVHETVGGAAVLRIAVVRSATYYVKIT